MNFEAKNRCFIKSRRLVGPNETRDRKWLQFFPRCDFWLDFPFNISYTDHLFQYNVKRDCLSIKVDHPRTGVFSYGHVTFLLRDLDLDPITLIYEPDPDMKMKHIPSSITWAVRLSWLGNAYSHPVFWPAILTSKVGHIDLVFGVRSRFISRSVHAGLQLSVCSGYNLCHPG